MFINLRLVLKLIMDCENQLEFLQILKNYSTYSIDHGKYPQNLSINLPS